MIFVLISTKLLDLVCQVTKKELFCCYHFKFNANLGSSSYFTVFLSANLGFFLIILNTFRIFAHNLLLPVSIMNKPSNSHFSSPKSNNDNQQAPLSPLERLHPYQIILYFALGGISVLFLMLTAAYLYSAPAWQWTQFRLPKIFLLSTFVLLGSSGTIYRAQRAYKDDNPSHLKKWLSYTLYLSLFFVALQTFGWLQLQRMGIFMSGRPDGSYLYLLTGLHALHVLTGLIFLYSYHSKARRTLNNDPVAELLFFSTPIQKINLQLLAVYWHFIDILWIYLLFFFLFNHL